MQKVKKISSLNYKLVEWNNQMYKKYPTGRCIGIAGHIEHSRGKAVLQFAEIKPTEAILEVGCEGGNLLINVPNAKRIVGADISSTALNDAANLFENQGRFAEFFQCDAQEYLPFSKDEFDVIICSEVLEHVPNPRRVLENIYDISTDKTRIVISVPIEAPKVAMKKILKSMGLFGVLFPRIEEGQSEWHLHAFSKNMFYELNNKPTPLFRILKEKIVWCNHYVALLKKYN